jgi:XTP/dITP diphosphohydrolase/tetrapyrrole methylase family protein/MazG family protein
MAEINKLVDILKKLRGSEGCSWDKKQTLESLKEYLLEETYETLEAMDQGGDNLKGELGDLLLNIAFQAQICEEKNEFNMKDVIESICQKLIRRHPHIFLEKDGNLTPEEVKKQWNKIKSEEKEHKDRKSILDGIPTTFPAMLRTEKIAKKVAEVGFQWENKEGFLDKIMEEINEMKIELEKGDKEKTGEEIGDILFSIITFSNYLGYNSSELLEKTNKKFKKRFNYIENKCDIQNTDLDSMDKLWNEAKKNLG